MIDPDVLSLEARAKEQALLIEDFGDRASIQEREMAQSLRDLLALVETRTRELEIAQHNTRAHELEAADAIRGTQSLVETLTQDRESIAEMLHTQEQETIRLMAQVEAQALQIRQVIISSGVIPDEQNEL